VTATTRSGRADSREEAIAHVLVEDGHAAAATKAWDR
jgi:hypothetical protein